MAINIITTILEDDPSTYYGGLDHVDETLGEFLECIDFDYDLSLVTPDSTIIKAINSALKECGIKPVKFYKVTYDYCIDVHYYPHEKIVTAKNAKDAKDQIKNEYYAKVNEYYNKGYSYRSACRKVRWPFHIEAHRIKED